MPDPKHGMVPKGTSSEYKEAPHLTEYRWNHPRERHRLPDDLVIRFAGLGYPAREIPELSVPTATTRNWPIFRGYPPGSCSRCGQTLNDDTCPNNCPQSFGMPSSESSESVTTDEEPPNENNIAFIFMLTTEESKQTKSSSWQDRQWNQDHSWDRMESRTADANGQWSDQDWQTHEEPRHQQSSKIGKGTGGKSSSGK